MKKTLSAFVVFYFLWLVLAGQHIQELIAGAVVSILLALIIGKVVNYDFGPEAVVVGVKYTILFVPLFIWKLILANLQMARIVLSPELPIEPGFVVVKTGLKKDISKLSLANAITMTPGTLSIDFSGDEVLIHWVAVQGGTPEEQGQNIAGSFEKRLGGIFE